MRAISRARGEGGSYEALLPLIRPTSIAVIGAAREPYKIGHQILKNLVEGGFPKKKIYPVNPFADTILGLKCYRSVKDVPGPVDMAVIAVPARVVPTVLRECAEKGVKAVVVISAGFKEVGRVEEERELVEIAKKGGMRLLGPNVIGLCDTVKNVNASFCQCLPHPGDIAFVTQSGALGIAAVGWTRLKSIGLSDLIGIGNKADVDEVDLIEFFGDDPHTKVVALYLEGVSRGREFLEVARRVSRKKPIVVLKAGRAERAARAIRSHTGSLAGSDIAYEAAFKQAGVLRASSFQELFDWAVALSKLPLPQGRGTVILTNGGGAGVMATDYANSLGLELMDIPEDLAKRLRRFMPPFGSTLNPVDLTGMATSEWYRGALEVLLEDPRVHSVVVLYCHTAQTDPGEIADAVVEAWDKTGREKPVVASFIGGEECAGECARLTSKGIPCYESPERAVSALVALYRYKEYLERREGGEYPVLEVDRERAAEIIERAKSEGRFSLTSYEALRVAEAYGVPIPPQHLAKSEEEAAEAAERIGYPVVLIVESPDIVHKTEVGGIKLGLESREQVVQAFREIMASVSERAPEAEIRGIVVRKMVPKGVEVIVGVHRDPCFGPLVMFGSGGVLVELLKDVSFRIAPLAVEDVREMISETKVCKVLEGYRGMPVADMERLVEVVLRISRLALDFPEITDIDVNPLFVYEKGEGCVAVDVKVLLEEVEKPASAANRSGSG